MAGGRPTRRRRSVRHRSARAVTSSACGCELHAVGAPAVLLVLWTLGTASRGGQVPGGCRAASRATSARDAYTRALALERQGNRLGRARRSSGMPRALRPTIPISRTHSERRSTASAHSTPRLTRSAVRSPNAPGFRKAANNLILTLVKAGQGEEAVARAKALVAEAPQRCGPLLHPGPCRVGTGCRCRDRDVPPRARTSNPRHTLARYNLALVLKRADRLPEAVDTLDARGGNRAAPRGVLHPWRDLLATGGHRRRCARTARGGRGGSAATARPITRWVPSWPSGRSGRAAADALRRAISVAARTGRRARHARAGASAVRRHGSRDARNLPKRNACVAAPRSSRKPACGRRSGAGRRKRQPHRARSISSAGPPPSSKEYAPAHYQIGLVLERLGQKDAARAAFARAAQLNPGLVATAAVPLKSLFFGVYPVFAPCVCSGPVV